MRIIKEKEKLLYWEDSGNLTFKEAENCFSVLNKMFAPSISTGYSWPHKAHKAHAAAKKDPVLSHYRDEQMVLCF